MATTTKDEEDRIAFEDVVQSLETQVANLGAHLTIDSRARMIYACEIRNMAEQLRDNASSGKSHGRRLLRRRKRPAT